MTNAAIELVDGDAGGAASHPDERKGIWKKTLSELGPNLPIGISAGGGPPIREFAVRGWKTKDEREIAALLAKKKGSMARHASIVLAHMLTRFGPYTFTAEENNAHRRIFLNQAYLADVFYAYVYMRREVLGPSFEVDTSCMSCGRDFTFVGNLDTLEVRGVDSPDSLQWSYSLRDPCEIQKRTVRSIQLSNPRWGMFDGPLAQALDDESAKVGTVACSIIGLNDEPIEPGRLGVTDLDDMTKRDFETIIAQVNEDFIGPKMSVETSCPKCAVDILRPINWRYEDFFRASSRSRQRN